MNDALKILAVISGECFITCCLLLFYRLKVISDTIQKMLVFLIGTIGSVLTMYVSKMMDNEIYWLFVICTLLMTPGLIAGVIVAFAKKEYRTEEVVVDIPEGSYHVDTVDVGSGSNIMMQYRLYYKEACYILSGAMPQDREAVKLYAKPTKQANLYMASIEINRKDIKWTFKKRERWLHDRVMVLYWYLTPILFAWLGVERQATKYIAILAFLSFGVWYFRGAKGLLFKMLYFFCRGLELFFYFAFLFLSMMELLH